MKIVDCYGVNDGSTFVSMELAEDRFVDVKVCDGNPDGNVYVMENEDGSTVYTGVWKTSETCPDFEYDEKAVLKLVAETMKEFGRDCMGEDGSFPLPSFLKELRDKVASGQMTVQKAAYELGYEGWVKVYSAETARALMQLPREHIHVAIEDMGKVAEEIGFQPKLVRNDKGEYAFVPFYRIVCVNEMANLGDLFEPLDDRVFLSEDEARTAVQEDKRLELVSLEELKSMAIDYICGKPLEEAAPGQVVLDDVLKNAESKVVQEQKRVQNEEIVL